MSTENRPKALKRAVWGGAILFLLVVAGGWILRWHTQAVTAPQNGIDTTTSSPTALSDVPVATPTTVGAIPDSLSAIIPNFYAAYEAKSITRLKGYFTPDSGTDVFPATQLFKSNPYQEYPVSYTILASAQQGQNWVITIQEERISPDVEAQFARTTLLTFIPGPADSGGWIVSAYSYVGSIGKYNAFISE